MEDTTQKRKAVLKDIQAGQIDLPVLAERVLELQTTDKLTLAVALLMDGKLELAETVVQRAADELKLARLLGGTPRTPR